MLDNKDAIVRGMGKNTRLLTLEEADAVLLAEDSEYRRLVFSQVTASAFGIAVLKYRLDHGLSQRALGKRLGMAQPQIARIEDGEHTPTLDTLCRVCDALGLEIDLRIGPREDGKRSIPRALQKGVFDSSDQVIVSIRER
jgi:ribosome-binding protein aMBF1 (putative translation factor)